MNAESLLTPAEYEAAIQQDPRTPIHYWRLGLSLLLAGEAEAAQMAWLSGLAAAAADQVDRWQLDLISLLQTAASDQLERQQFAPTVTICEQILALTNCPTAHHLLAQALAQQGDYEAAIAAWQQAVAQQPDFVEAQIQLAEVQQKLGDWEAAIESYTRALQQAPTANLHLELGRCYVQQNQSEAALFQFQQAAHLRPDWAAPLAEWGCALLNSGDSSGAIAQFQSALSLLSIVPAPYANLTQQVRQQADLSVTSQAALPAERSLVPPPSGFYETTAAWSRQHYQEIEPETQVALHPPRSLDRSIHFSFRFGESIALPGAFVATIPDGRFWQNADDTSCACITPDDRLLPELSPEFPILSPGHPDSHPRHHSIFQRSGLEPIQQIKGTVAVLNSLQNNLYFHWMFEVLPRWNILSRSAIDLDSIDYILVYNQLPFQQETIGRLGISKHRILSGDRHLHLQADRLIVPFTGSIAWMSRSSCEFLRAAFLPSVQIENRRIYISRSRANRRVINEVEVVDLLEKLGFESVTLETLSVVEQAALFASAKVVIAPHGGGLTNLVFCSSGTVAIELFSPNYVYPCYWFLSSLAELDYYYLLGEMPLGASVQHLLYPDARIEDIYIDVSKLLELMHYASVI